LIGPRSDTLNPSPSTLISDPYIIL
jgi:hypothetical protein